MIIMARIIPSVGESTIATSVLLSPVHWIPVSPAVRHARTDKSTDQGVAG